MSDDLEVTIARIEELAKKYRWTNVTDGLPPNEVGANESKVVLCRRDKFHFFAFHREGCGWIGQDFEAVANPQAWMPVPDEIEVLSSVIQQMIEKLRTLQKGSCEISVQQYNEVVRAHASVLADNDHLTETAEGLRRALRQALNQWRMYAEQDPDFESTDDPTLEGIEYRKCCAVLTENNRIPKREIRHIGKVSDLEAQ